MNAEQLHALGFDRSEATEGGHVHVECSGCDAVVINGTPTHERGCPNRPVECRECGSMHPTRDAAAICCAPCEDDES